MSIYYKVKSYDEIQSTLLPHGHNPNFTHSMKYLCDEIYDESQTSLQPEEYLLKLDGWWVNKLWLIKGEMIDGEFVPFPDEEQGYDLSEYIRSRSEWEPETHPIKVASKVLTLIDKAVKQVIPDGVEDWFEPSNWKAGYDFTWVDFSSTGDHRLSGISFNKLQAMCWNGITNDNSILPKKEEVKDRYNYFCTHNQISSEIRNQQGTYIKPSKLLRYLLPNLTDSQITTISSKLADLLREKAVIALDDLKISATPSEIYTLYSCFDSCMRNQDEERFHIYDDLQHTSILYLLDDDGDKLIGRALLHDEVHVMNVDGVPDTIKMMDRIYYRDADVLAKFKAWAVKNGYWYKQNQSLGCYDFHNPTNTDKVIRIDNCYIYCSDLKEKYGQVPYIDTFYCYHEANNNYYLSPRTELFGKHRLTYMQETNGEDSEGIITNTCRYCVCCDNAVSQDYVYTNSNGDIYCEECYNETYASCQHCGDGEIYVENLNTVHDRYGNEIEVCNYCFENRYTYCEECEEYHDNRNIIEHEGDYYCTHCYEQVIAREAVEVDEESIEESSTDSLEHTSDVCTSETVERVESMSLTGRVDRNQWQCILNEPAIERIRDTSPFYTWTTITDIEEAERRITGIPNINDAV